MLLAFNAHRTLHSCSAYVAASLDTRLNFTRSLRLCFTKASDARFWLCLNYLFLCFFQTSKLGTHHHLQSSSSWPVSSPPSSGTIFSDVFIARLFQPRGHQHSRYLSVVFLFPLPFSAAQLGNDVLLHRWCWRFDPMISISQSSVASFRERQWETTLWYLHLCSLKKPHPHSSLWATRRKQQVMLIPSMMTLEQQRFTWQTARKAGMVRVSFRHRVHRVNGFLANGDDSLNPFSRVLFVGEEIWRGKADELYETKRNTNGKLNRVIEHCWTHIIDPGVFGV